MEIDIDFVNDKQKNLNERLTHIETNCKYVDERINQLQSSLETSKNEADECNQKIIYSEVYSRSENKKFEGIAEASQLEARTMLKMPSGLSWKRTQNWGRRAHRVPADTQARQTKNDNGIVAERLLHVSWDSRAESKFKSTYYRMFEDIPCKGITSKQKSTDGKTGGGKERT